MAMAVTERGALTCWPSVAPRPGRGKSWVLAMLAPKRGLRVAPVPPKTADLTRPTRGRQDNRRSGRRNRRFDRTKEQSHARRGLAVSIIRRLQSFTQWWVRLNKPHTQKFGHSPFSCMLQFMRKPRVLMITLRASADQQRSRSKCLVRLAAYRLRTQDTGRSHVSTSARQSNCFAHFNPPTSQQRARTIFSG